METIFKKIKTPEGYYKYRITDENVELVSIFVEPEHRRKGEGTKMVEKIIAIAKGRRKACIYCFTRKSNKEAKKFYKALGFERVCKIQGFYRSEDGIMYIKRL